MTCSSSLVMNFTNCRAASLFLVNEKTAMLIPATMLLIFLPPLGAFSSIGTGATPYAFGSIFWAFSDEPAACQSSIAALPLAKSLTDWFCAYSALLGLTILSVDMKPMYRLSASTFSGESNVALPDESNHCPPYCWPNANAWCEFSEMLAPSSARPHWPALVSFLPSATSSAQVAGGAAMPASANIFLL